jgi:phage gpG-like protein
LFTIEFEKDGVIEKLKTAALMAEDLELVFYKFGAYLVKKAKAKYEAQNFTPLASSTLKHRAAEGLKNLERKLAKDVGRALKRQDLAKAPKSLVAKAFRAFGIESETNHTTSRGVINRAAVLSEFRRRYGMGKSRLSEIAGAKELTLKQKTSLRGRIDRAVSRAKERPILGQLNRSPIFEVGEDSVTLISRTKTEFSDVHNSGGSANHGARIPKRETIAVDDDDIDFLKKLLVEHCLAAVEE